MKQTTLLFLRRHDELLLAMKKRGFGKGRWNGVGGKIEPDETDEQAAARECYEEIGVRPIEFEKVAILDFTSQEGQDNFQSHTYFCEKWHGTPHETDEMAPQWFKLSEIPYDSMWEDDIVWLPQLLLGKKLISHFTFDNHNHMLTAKIEIIRSFA